MIEEKNLRLIIYVALAVIFTLGLGMLTYNLFFPSVTIRSNFPETALFVDGSERGLLPQTLRLKSGLHEIKGAKDFYEPATLKINIKPFLKNEFDLVLDLKKLTDSQWSNLSDAEKEQYERLSDWSADYNEAAQREDQPLTKYLPKSDPQGRYRIDYSGPVFNTRYLVTIYSNTEKEAKLYKSQALDWIRSKGVNPNTLKIQYDLNILGPARNDYNE